MALVIVLSVSPSSCSIYLFQTIVLAFGSVSALNRGSPSYGMTHPAFLSKIL